MKNKVEIVKWEETEIKIKTIEKKPFKLYNAIRYLIKSEFGVFLGAPESTCYIEGDYSFINIPQEYTQEVHKREDLKSLITDIKKLEEYYLKYYSENIGELREPITESQFSILTDPSLFMRVIREFDKKIVGEENTRKDIFLTSCLRLVKNCDPTSSNLFVNSESGAGKDHLCGSILPIWKGKYIKRTRISPAVFTYWKPVEDWTGHILYLEDISSGVLNSDVFKVMSSGGSFATIVVKQKAVDIEIIGKPVIVITGAFTSPNFENLRRFPITNLDDSNIQTKAIMKKKLQRARGDLNEEYDNDLVKALIKLKPVNVFVEFAEELESYLPAGHIIMRTNSQRFIDLIKASAGLHQFQREHSEKGIIASWEDYDIAREIINNQSSNEYTLPLTKNQKKILKQIEELGEEGFSVSEIEKKVNFLSDKMLRIELEKLRSFDLLSLDFEQRDGIKQKVKTYRLIKSNKLELPSSKEIKNNCRNITKVTSVTKDKKVTNVTKVTINKGLSRTIETIVTFPVEKCNSNEDFSLFSQGKASFSKENLVKIWGSNEAFETALTKGMIQEVKPNEFKAVIK